MVSTENAACFGPHVHGQSAREACEGTQRAPPHAQVRYIVETMPVMLESGTKTLSLPNELYGCPYPVNPALPPGTCAAPELCNCNDGICFGTCKGEH